jgi:rubrerythrin
MSTYLYDEAIVKKFKNWTSTSKTQIYGPSETRRLFEIIADKTTDSKIKLPFISINRELGYDIINDGTTRRPLSYDGVNRMYDPSTKTMTIMNAIPITIRYQVNVYARYAQEADILMRNLIFNIVNFPAMTIDVPAADQEHTARISIADTTIRDTSNIAERFIEGNLTCLSISIEIRDAYLWDVRKHRDAEIELRIDDIYENKNFECLSCGFIYQGYIPPAACPMCGENNWQVKPYSRELNSNQD